MGTCVHFSRSLPSNSWWQTMAGWQALLRPSAAESGGRRAAFTGLGTPPYSAPRGRRLATAQPGVSKPGRSTDNAGNTIGATLDVHTAAKDGYGTQFRGI